MCKCVAVCISVASWPIAQLLPPLHWRPCSVLHGCYCCAVHKHLISVLQIATNNEEEEGKSIWLLEIREPTFAFIASHSVCISCFHLTDSFLFYSLSLRALIFWCRSYLQPKPTHALPERENLSLSGGLSRYLCVSWFSNILSAFSCSALPLVHPEQKAKPGCCCCCCCCCFCLLYCGGESC